LVVDYCQCIYGSIGNWSDLRNQNDGIWACSNNLIDEKTKAHGCTTRIVAFINIIRPLVMLVWYSQRLVCGKSP